MGLDPSRGLLVAVGLHVLLYFLADAIDPPEPKTRELIEIEMLELPPEPKAKPPEPPPKPEPEPEPEPEKQPEPEPKPIKPKTKVTTPKPTPPAEPEPAPAAKPPKRFSLPESETVPAGSGSDVKVNPGPNTSSGSGSGTPGGNGTGKGNGTGSGDGAGGQGTKPGTPWSPRGDLFVAEQPRVLRVPEVECPAVSERQVSGTVVLMVQVQRDGKVRSARVTKAMGHGCDDIAKKALRQAKFAPAVGTDGKSVDYELRYEYAFELRD